MRPNGASNKAAGKNLCFVTAVKPTVYTEQKQIEHDWNEGKPFQLYRNPGTVDKGQAFKLRIAGFTHVMVVWQNPQEGNSVMGCEIDLAYGTAP